MVKRMRILAALLVVASLAGMAMADGMIVPVRPEIRVRGSWAVKYHHVNVQVRDQVASVSIDQAFVNTGGGMIEVEYLFPVPPGAAVDSMTLMVNGKEYAARLLKAEEARKIYESIVRRKKDPALLEYAGFGLYRTKAFPLEPGKPCKVLTTYKNVCKKDRNLVEVWYPLNTEKYSAKKIESVEVTVDIKSKADLSAVYSPTHDLSIKRKGPRRVIATYTAKDVLPTTDFQVFYKAANEEVGATLLTHQPDKGKDGYFMVLASPSPRASQKEVVAKDLVLVFDHSGSMSGKKIQQAKAALNFILNKLNKRDRFNVIAYSDSVEPFFEELVKVNRENLEKAADLVDRLEATGGTNIHEAISRAMQMLSAGSTRRPKYVIFLTDGLPTVGNTNETAILRDAKKANKCGARLFAFGAGYDVNVRLLDKLVAENRGRSDYVKPKEPIESKISSLYAKIKNPVVTDIKVKIPGLKLRDRYPREMDDLFEGDQIVLVGRYDCKDVKGLAGEGKRHRAQLVITGMYQGKEKGFEYPVTINPGGKDLRYAFVEKLWAIRRVGFLLDEIQLHGKSKEVIDELVRLSMKYGIMTPYTSFLADETTPLAKPRVMHRRAARYAKGLADGYTGGGGQVAAKNRQTLNEARRPAPASAPPGGPGKADSGSRMWGHDSVAAYEGKKKQEVRGVRNVGDQAVYRRGRVWIAANAAKLDLEKDKDKIRRIKRFSEEYFRLVRANTTPENQILSSQAEGEQLLITLRGQAYMID